ncbi:MAG: helix-turn-helix transcriptional regulator [Clostridiales bacterium]|nr:helix-turn-helix transcriptional regulator [Clostridiales bacterium]
MKFNEYINDYIEKLNCTAKELSEASGLSSAVISRYRTGERRPEPESDNLKKLAAGIAAIANAKNIAGMTINEVQSVLQHSLNHRNADYDTFTANYNALITTLEINMKELSSATNFDTSYLYRVRSGQRRPKDLDAFADGFCRFITARYNEISDKAKVAELIGCKPESIWQNTDYLSHLKTWLYHTSTENTTNYMGSFLEKLDEFDLNEYIRAIHFDELKVPSMPFQLPTSKNYYGVEEMRKGELDFFKFTVLSKSMEPIFMCSDMPMDDMAKDMDFNKKWMFAIAMSLKKGLHLNIIHNIDRPFHEMMLGLEAWIPIYMTGQISPYHLPNISTSVYHHFNYVSGSVALTGECIHGHHDKGKYYLTNNKEEVSYYKEKAVCLLEKAQPLMEIFTETSEQLFLNFLHSTIQKRGKRHNVLSALPIYTISPELLEKILTRNHISEKKKEKILEYAKQERNLTETILQDNIIFDEVIQLSPEEFEKHPMKLFVAGAFCDTEIPYTYKEFQEHLNQTKNFAACHENYKLKESNEHAFRNIQIQILEGNYVLISKAKSPVIHFVIRHPKIVRALENFIPPVVE